MSESISIFWFRRDLRLDDNHGLFKALSGSEKVLPIFIFDTNIIDELPRDDSRISFIYAQLDSINESLRQHKSSLLCLKGNPIDVFKELITQHKIKQVFTNKDYEPYALNRDEEISALLGKNDITFNTFKDQVIFEKDDILKPDGSPYTVFTPYKKKWLNHFINPEIYELNERHFKALYECDFNFPSLSDIGFEQSSIKDEEYSINHLQNYQKQRDFPGLNGTSHLSAHLRFGTVGIRRIVTAVKDNESFLSELIWREFFMQILYHFPKVVRQNFKSKYDSIPWRNKLEEFEKWKAGETGYPIVDAGMRELNQTGYMHNRVRMITASFLCKHLLINWQWGEAYFAEKLLDYDLALNNGNWQWAAGTGCDAAPYFRIFNPTEQTKKFDSNLEYINKWVPELNSLAYPQPIVEHKFARQRALDTYKIGIEQY